jgi:hypothetical protein
MTSALRTILTRRDSCNDLIIANCDIEQVFQIFFGIGAIVLFPIMGFISGLIQGLIFAVVYNFLAPKIGGIKLQFD